MTRGILIFASLFVTATASALPPAEHGRGFRDGANHHLGDDSFVIAHGRAPAAGDDEHERMHVHLAYVRDQLSARPPTRPALAARRGELLHYLDDYIAAGITPRNTYVPWRSPVFIDAGGRICAVGYLIERSAGRALPEAIASAHRTEFLEDIAAAVPEVSAWVASSGFTLEELASIQPGYEGPDVQFAVGLDPAKIVDGPYKDSLDGITITGTLAKRAMTGTWTRTNAKGTILGAGTFANGAGTWRSNFADGTRMAEGRFARSRPHGTWSFYFPSGRLAARGSFKRGVRDADWTFYHDAKSSPVISRGRIKDGLLVGTWRHYDAKGTLIATASDAPRRGDNFSGWLGLSLKLARNQAGVTREIHEGVPAERWRLDGLFVGGERFYAREDGAIFDVGGHKLEPVAGGWQARDCAWKPTWKAFARKGDVPGLHGQLIRTRYNGTDDTEKCGPATRVAAARVKTIETALAALHTPIAETPAVLRARLAAPRWKSDPDTEAETVPAVTATVIRDLRVRADADFGSVIAAGMTWYMEWPHVDDLFREVFATLPGYKRDDDTGYME